MMPISRLRESNWMLVEWYSGSRDVVHVKELVAPKNKELRAGDEMTVIRNGKLERVKMVAHARDRRILDPLIQLPRWEEEAGPSSRIYEKEPKDFSSSSSSSGVPFSSDDGASTDSLEVEEKKVDDKIITPSSTVTSKVINDGQKHTKTDTCHCKCGLAPKVHKNKPKTMQISLNELIDIDNRIMDMLNQLQLLKKLCMAENLMLQRKNGKSAEEQNAQHILNNNAEQEDTLSEKEEDLPSEIEEDLPSEIEEDLPSEIEEDLPREMEEDLHSEMEEDSHSENEEFNRSNDNVLITNKHNNVVIQEAHSNQPDEQWVPIGTGKTLVLEDKYNQVNWTSFTVATRSLLLAVFSKRVLATHSLTGKKSPAFQHKPAKKGLNPIKINDIIVEVVNKFQVRENLIRAVITTKCADECRMWKNRANKRNSNGNNENLPPPGLSSSEDSSSWSYS